MTDVFISYSSKDSEPAKKLYSLLHSVGVDTFLAEISIKSSDKWKEKIVAQMNEAKWVILLMSRNASKSMAVAHEIGAAIFSKKNMHVIIWDMEPNEIPSWIQDIQVINLAKGEQYKVNELINELSRKVKIQKWIIVALVMGVIAWIMYKIVKRP